MVVLPRLSSVRTENDMTLSTRPLPSPVGTLTLVASDAGLVAVLWQDDDPARVLMAEQPTHAANPILDAAADQLSRYFDGTLRQFDLPLDFRGTGFQKRVWAALLDIPFGETRSYGQIAASLDAPGAARAVGAANGRNPISIIAPCHRVVGSSGKLTGFAGGLAAKAWLLNHERRASAPELFDAA